MSEKTRPPAAAWKRALKWGGVSLAALLVLVVLVIGGVFAFLRTDEGLDRLARWIETAVSSDEMTLAIGRLDGLFPERLVITDITLSDQKGEMITVDAGELVWRPLELFSGRLEVNRLHLDGVDVERLPAGAEAEEPAPEEDGAPGLPQLPLDVVVDDVRVAPLRLSAAVSGLEGPVELAINAEAKVLRSQAYSTALRVERLDGVPTLLTADAEYDGAREWLRVAVDGNEPPGGLLATLLGVPGEPAIRIDVHGEGPIADWKGRLEAVAEETASLVFDIELTGKAPVTIAATGHVDVERLLPEAARPMVADGIDIVIKADAGEERIEVHRLDVAAAAATLTGSATYLPEDQRLDGGARLALGPAETFRGLGADVGYDTAIADLRFAGTLPALAADLDVRATSLAAQGYTVADLALTAQVDPGGDSDDGALPPFDVALDLVAAGIVSPMEAVNDLLDEAVRLSLAGDVTPETSQATVEKLTLTAGPIILHGSGEASFASTPTGSAQLRTEPIALAAFSTLAGQPLSGQAALRANIDAPAADTREATLTVAIDEFSSENPQLAALVGDALDLTAELRQQPESGAVFDVDLTSASLQLTADGALTPDLSALNQATVRVVADDLARFKALAPDLGGGQLRVDASAAGPFDALAGELRLTGSDIAYQTERVDRLSLTVDAEKVPTAPAGTIALAAESSLGPLTLNTPFAVTDGERLRLADLRLLYDNALSAIGDLTVPLGGQPITGTLAVSAEQLEPIGRRFDVAVGGNLQLDTRLSGEDGLQRVQADLAASGLRYGDAEAPTAEVERLTATVDALDPAARRRVTLTAVAENISVADGQLDRTTVDVSGAGGEFEVQARTTGDLQGLTELDALAEIDLDAGPKVVLRSLDALIREETLKLLRPAMIVTAGERLEVDDLALSYGEAVLEANLLKAPRDVDGKVTLRNFELTTIDRFTPTGVRGTVNADVTLSGTPQAPTVRLETTATNLGSHQVDPTGREAVDATITGEITNDRAQVDVAMKGLGETPLTSELTVPVRFAIEPFQFAVVENRPMSGTIKWSGQVGPVFRLLPIDSMVVGGLANIDIAIAGTPAAPAPTGKVTLTDGMVEVFVSGTVLKPLNLEADIVPEEVRITRLEAGDAGDGSLSGHGTVSLAGPVQADVALDIDNAVLVRRDDVISRLSGTVDFVGTVGERADLLARIKNDATEIRLVDRLPPSVKTLGVEYADAANEGDAPPPEETEPPAEPWLFLDVEVDMPERVFIRGRGLDSEWAGKASVKGSAEAPDVEARLEPVRGDFTFLGKLFTLQKGAVVVNGLDQPIPVDLTAAYSESNFKALIIVSGTASDPKLTFTSEPELPQDEILARVLFDKSTGKLTPAEAVQLASAAATLASGERGMLDKLRDAAGLDRLAVGGGSEDDGLVTVEAGRYVADGVYVGVEQGATTQSSTAVVEVDITDNIKARSTMSGEGTSSAGIRWEWEY